MTTESSRMVPEYIRQTLRDLEQRENAAAREAQEFRRLRTQILRIYKLPDGNRDQDAESDLSDCPLSAAEMVSNTDPYVTLCAIGYRAPENKVNQTRAARWMSAAGLTRRAPKSYKTTLGRMMDKQKDHWEWVEPGTYKYIGPPVPANGEHNTAQEQTEDETTEQATIIA